MGRDTVFQVDGMSKEFKGMVERFVLADNILHIYYAEGHGKGREEALLRDDMQLCCERRYISTDDDLELFNNVYLHGVVPKKWAEDDLGVSTWEMVFIDVVTSRGVFTLCTHNVHNGYYGGFNVTMTWES